MLSKTIYVIIRNLIVKKKKVEKFETLIKVFSLLPNGNGQIIVHEKKGCFCFIFSKYLKNSSNYTNKKKKKKLSETLAFWSLAKPYRMNTEKIKFYETLGK